MASVDATSRPTVSQTNTPANSRRGHRRPHRGASRRVAPDSQPAAVIPPLNANATGALGLDPSLAFRPASVAPSSQPASAGASSAEHSATENSAAPTTPRRGTQDNRRGSRAGRRGRIAPGRDHATGNGNNLATTHDPGGSTAGGLPHGRQFGGRLTTSQELSDSVGNATLMLSADAPEFLPGQKYHDSRAGRGRGNRKAPPIQHGAHSTRARHRQNSGLKSTAPDIATRTHEDIANALYECPICTSEIGRDSRVWSCKTCWTITKLGGVVVKSAAIQCRVGNMTARSLVTRVSAELAKSTLIPAATVGRRRERYLVAIEMRREPARCLRAVRMDQVQAKSGLDHSSAKNYATENTIAASTDATRNATRKMPRLRTALGPQTWSTIVHAVRPFWRRYLSLKDTAVRTQFRIAISSV
ncbi:MAG: hypothetical protein Q9182_006804 [Xanthomendoza sp. 2 TL-2023]